jgi:hypothetical protein
MEAYWRVQRPREAVEGDRTFDISLSETLYLAFCYHAQNIEVIPSLMVDWEHGTLSITTGWLFWVFGVNWIFNSTRIRGDR